MPHGFGAALELVRQLDVADGFRRASQFHHELVQPTHGSRDRALEQISLLVHVVEVTALAPRVRDLAQRHFERVAVLVHVHRNSARALRLAHKPRRGLQARQRLGERVTHGLLVYVLVLLGLLHRDEARAQRDELVVVHLLERAVEHELGHQQLVRGVHPARRATLQLQHQIRVQVVQLLKHLRATRKLVSELAQLRRVDLRRELSLGIYEIRDPIRAPSGSRRSARVWRSANVGVRAPV